MSNTKTATAKQKAQRRQHRKDHFTEADRLLSKQYKGDQKGRVAARKEGYQTDNATASDFNFDEYGKEHISGAEVKHLRQQGQSREDIMAAARASGDEMGVRATDRFARWEAKAAKAAKASEEKAKAPEEKAQDLLQEKIGDVKDSFNIEVNQNQSFDRTFGDNKNTIGNDNTFKGDVNQGNQDMSTNKGTQKTKTSAMMPPMMAPMIPNASTTEPTAANQAQPMMGAITDSFNTDIQQKQSFNRNFGNNKNKIGNSNMFVGSVNQGNQDMSRNMGVQGVLPL